MSAQRRRKLHRLFGRSTTAVPDLTPPPLSQTFQSTPPPPSARCGSLTAAFLHSMCQVFFIWVHFRFTGVDSVCRRRRFLCSLVTQLSGFSEIMTPEAQKPLREFKLFLLAGEEYTDRCVTGFGLLSLGDSRLLVLMFQRFCNPPKGQIECSDAAPFSVTRSQPSQDPGILARPGRRGHQRRVLQGLQSVERRHPARNHAHHGRRGRHHDQFRTQW